MTEAGSAAFGAVWRVKEAKLVECPALANSLPEFKTTYDIEPHAELLGFDDSDWAVIPPADLGVRRVRRPGVVHLVPRDPDDPRERRGLRHRRRQGGVPRQRRRLRGSLDQRRDAAHPNGPISAAPRNFLFVREARVDFFR
jgi:hypothetical protein